MNSLVWLSSRVLEVRLRCLWCKTHRQYHVVSLRKTLYPLINTGSSQEARKTGCLPI